MRIPVFLADAQWAMLLALGLLVLTAYRQLGRVMGRSGQPAELGPPAGSQPGKIDYTRLSGGGQADGADAPSEGAGRPGQHGEADGRAGQVCAFVPGGGQPALLAFVDPTCPSCEELVTSLGAAREAGDLDGVRVLLLTSDPPSYLQISAVFRAATLEIGRPLDRDDLEPYRATATPLLVAIDAGGVVRAAGTAVRLAEVRAYGQACLLPAPPDLLPVTG
ncbi:MAG TPA: hypothetical protein VFV41_14615 [Streptosporangiaceae bacterium]|nr:hypothetical protein [Streptosporangiaceae bacterium]